MPLRCSPFVCVSLVHAAGWAQNYVVSPAQYTTYEAAASSSDPFGGFGRCQQIHGDLRGSARSLTQLAWRRDGSAATNAAFLARSPDIEVSLAGSNLAGVSATFANNIVGAATTVFPRTTVNGPDLTSQPAGMPAPWTFAITFTAPWAFTGTSDLVYDIKIFTNTSGNPYPFDAVSGRDAAMFGGCAPVGLGCLNANGNMTLRSSFLTNSSTNQLTMQWSVQRGPSTQPLAILLGITNPNLFVPNLCGRIYTDASVTVIGGVTDSLGSWVSPAVSVAWRPFYAGFALTAQAGAYDLFQTPSLPVTVSNGISSTVAPAPLPPQLARVLAASAPTAATGSVSIGYGLITRFEY